MVKQHSKNITKPKSKFSFVQRNKKTFDQKVHFTLKDRFANYLSHGTLGTIAAIMRAEVLQSL